ncbi:MAG: hypothetical protein JW891_17800 [Candidatus Lokiarchaeota archaeon]|nr:hypothetical protein [Candidatus Lokiarchaeota archaeon]
MKGLESVYLINSNGKLVFSIENSTRKTQINRPEALSDFLGLMEAIASRLGNQQINLIELGRSTIYSNLDKYNNILFVIKCDKKTKKKKIDELFSRLRYEFVRIFDGNLNKPNEVKRSLMNEFANIMIKLCGTEFETSHSIEELKFIL